MKKVNKIYLSIAFISVIFLISLIYDFQISKSITSLRNSWLDSTILSLLYYNIVLAVILPLLIVFVHSGSFDKLKKSIRRCFILGISFVSVWIVNVAIKNIIARPRPFTAGIDTLQELIKSSYTSWDLSFPSNHAAIMFASIPFLPKKWVPWWIALAIIICFSRIYFGLHYLSDVIAGSVFGFLIGYFIKKKFDK